MKPRCIWALGLALAASSLRGQNAGGPPPPGPPGQAGAQNSSPFSHGHSPFTRVFHAGPPGRWWRDPDFVRLLALSPDQQNRMDQVFQANRPRLIDLSAAMQKEELAMEPLVDAEPPNVALVLAQIDRVAQARAELEKANARMLLGLRGALTPEQWQKLRASEPERQHDWHRRPEPGPPQNP